MSTLANPNAELALLGAALRANPEQLTQMAVTVREEAFSVAEHLLVWRVMGELINKSLPVAASLLEDGLRKHGTPESCMELVQRLAVALPSAKLWRPLWEAVKGYHIRRQGREKCLAGARAFEDLSMPHMQALEDTESGLFALHSANMGDGMRHVSASVAEAMASILESIEHRGHVTGGLACGFTDIDRMNIKGLRPGHKWIISAPPGGGKTVFLMKLLWNIATGKGDYHEFNHPAEKAGVFTLEMSDVALAERILIRLAQIEMHSLDRGMMNRGDQERIKRAVDEVTKSHLYMEYCPGITIQELRVKARYAVMRFGLKVIGVDYAQLIGSSSKDARGNRTQAMMDVSIGLGEMAKECGVPVIALAQPKQETWGTRAGLNALAETAQLAKDADMVIQLGVWEKLRGLSDDAEGAKKQGSEFKGKDGGDDFEVEAYADIVKNRNGPNTEGKPPIKLDWARDYFDFLSTNDRLFSNNEQQHQRR